ncbi:MAG: BREX system ATP-binding domain-containing protein [Thermomicrobiales bacterium]
MSINVIAMIERMAEYGTAPSDGCALFGVGYEEAFARLRDKYLDARFARGDSAEKFVVGPFGSGKTHFLRQLMELARSLDCVTAEVALNKDLDFTRSLVVYHEVTREIRTPGTDERGLRPVRRRARPGARARGGQRGPRRPPRRRLGRGARPGRLRTGNLRPRPAPGLRGPTARGRRHISGRLPLARWRGRRPDPGARTGADPGGESRRESARAADAPLPLPSSSTPPVSGAPW